VLDSLPGEESQVDFGLGAPTLHRRGRYRRPYLFVMTLKYSGKAFRKVVWKADQQTWARLHEEAFRAMGGSVAYVVLDNLKQGVIKPDLYEPRLNPVYAAMLAHFSAVADVARVADPNRKGAVERSDPAHPGHRAQGPPLRVDRGAERVALPLGGALGGSSHPRAQEAPGARDVPGGKAASESFAARALPLLPPGNTHPRRCRAHSRGCLALQRTASGLAISRPLCQDSRTNAGAICLSAAGPMPANSGLAAITSTASMPHIVAACP
jgi:hypothetical protein